MPDPIISDQIQDSTPPIFPEVTDTPIVQGVPQDTSTIAQVSEPFDIPPIITGPSSPKRGKGKIIATILGILLLVGAVGAGVLLVGQKQLLEQKAAGQCPIINECVADHPESRCNDQGQMCTFYIGEPGYESDWGHCTAPGTLCVDDSDHYCMQSGTCFACIRYTECFYKHFDNCVADESCGGSPPTSTSTPTPTRTPTPTPTGVLGACNAPCQADSQCGGYHCTTQGNVCRNPNCPNDTDCICPTPTPRSTPTTGPTPTPIACNASCQADSQCSTGYCTTAGICRNHNCPNDTDCNCLATNTPTPKVTSTPTPRPPMCSAVKAYDTDWNLLTGVQLSALSAGDVVIFAVSGTPADEINSAQFKINGVLYTGQVLVKEPGTYYIEYTIPTGVTSFTVTAQLNI